MFLKTLYILLFINIVHSQNNKEIQVTLSNFKINSNEIEFYLMSKNKIDKLKLINSKLNFEFDTKNEIKLMFKFRKRCIEFYINPNDIYYLEISKINFKLNNFFRKKYIINQGFDYIEIVKHKKCNIK